jgi:hypothetical protein
MKAGYKKRAAGGNIEPQGKMASDESPKDVYAGADSNVVKEAKARKKGGMCKAEGGKAAKRLDRPKRKAGGKVGANERPLSTAANVSDRPGGDFND